MDQILLRRSDEHTPRLSAERIPSHLSNACAEACDIMLLSSEMLHMMVFYASSRLCRTRTKT